MKTFEYSFFSGIIYRYGNIPVSIVLLFYLISAILHLRHDIMFIIPSLITFLLLFFLNRQYFKMYKLMPYKITVDNEKMICENFILLNKKVVIAFKEIDKLSGGIFEGRISGLMQVHDTKNNVSIGFYDKIKNARELETHILHLVDRKVYDEVVKKIGLRKEQTVGNIKEKAQKINSKKKKKNK